jgi:putative flippase GtrA
MIKEIFFKYRELILYIVFGALTTGVNYGCYFFFARVFNMYYILSNLISWIIAVVFAFIVNKYFVFFTQKSQLKILIREFSIFVSGRVVSLLVETVLLYYMVSICFLNDLFAKIIVLVIVVLINYVLSKYIVFI